MGALAGGLVQGFAQGKTQAQEQKAAKELRDIQVKIYKSQLEAEEKKSQALQKFSAQPPLNPGTGAIAAPMQNAGQMPAPAGDIPGMLASGQINYGDLSAIGVNPIEVTKMIAEMQAQKEQQALMAQLMPQLKGGLPDGGYGAAGQQGVPAGAMSAQGGNYGMPQITMGPNGPSLQFQPSGVERFVTEGNQQIGVDRMGRPVPGAVFGAPAQMSLVTETLPDGSQVQRVINLSGGGTGGGGKSGGGGITKELPVDDRPMTIEQAANFTNDRGEAAPAGVTPTDAMKFGFKQRKNPTEVQSKAVSFASRAAEANANIERIMEGYDPTSAQGLWDANTAGNGALNAAASGPGQEYQNASRFFINAVNRKDSGATITKEEISEALRLYIPSYGDSSEVLKQKAANRVKAIESITAEAGGFGGNVNGTAPTGKAATATGAQPPAGAKQAKDGNWYVKQGDGWAKWTP